MVYRSPMVFTFRSSPFTRTADTMTATRDGGIFLINLGHMIRIARDRAPMSTAMGFKVSIHTKTSLSFSMVSTGECKKVIPMKSLIWPMKMVTAMPVVNPVVMVYGMNRIRLPRRSTPMTISRMPASMVAAASPSMPFFSTIPATMVAKAAVGPAICTLLPPKKEMMKPATMAV